MGTSIAGCLRGLLPALLLAACTRSNAAYDRGESTGDSGLTDDSGDGPCATNNGGCHDAATCVPLGGDQFECVCPDGWNGDGLQCTPSLPALRVEMPCAEGNTCMEEGLCSMGSSTGTARFESDPTMRYAMEFRIRGVLELGSYTGGTQRDWYYVGGTPQTSHRNIYRLASDDGGPHLFLNLGTDDAQGSIPFDRTLTLEVQGGSTFTLSAQSGDGCGRTSDGISIPDVAPLPGGQFLQIDLVSAQVL